MGQAQDHVLGLEGRFFCVAEGTFGTFAKHAAADAFRCDQLNIKYAQERMDRDDAHGSRSLKERTSGKKSVEWDLAGDLIPSGTAGTPPDIHAIIDAAFGTYANSGSTSDTYTPALAQTALGSVQLTLHHGNRMRTAVGCLVDKFGISLNGGEKVKVKASGRAKDIIETGYATLGAQFSSGGSSATVTSALKENLMANSVVQFTGGTSDQNTNTQAGYLISARSGTTLTVSPVSAATFANSSAITPFTPTPTLAGTPIGGILGSLTIDGTAAIVTGFEYNLENGYIYCDDEAFQAGLTDGITSWRKVSGTISFRLRRDHIIHTGLSLSGFTTRALVITCGTAAGSICTINVPYAEVTPINPEVPKDKDATVTMEWVALSSSSGEDETSVVFT